MSAMSLTTILAGFSLLWALVSWLVGAFFTAYVAQQKSYSFLWWLILGFLFPFISLLTVIGLPDRALNRHVPNAVTHAPCSNCAEFVRKEAKQCPFCQHNLAVS